MRFALRFGAAVLTGGLVGVAGGVVVAMAACVGAFSLCYFFSRATGAEGLMYFSVLVIPVCLVVFFVAGFLASFLVTMRWFCHLLGERDGEDRRRGFPVQVRAGL